jgi:hypothetical protein
MALDKSSDILKLHEIRLLGYLYIPIYLFFLFPNFFEKPFSSIFLNAISSLTKEFSQLSDRDQHGTKESL